MDILTNTLLFLYNHPIIGDLFLLGIGVTIILLALFGLIVLVVVLLITLVIIAINIKLLIIKIIDRKHI
jgi:hypothetical protein